MMNLSWDLKQVALGSNVMKQFLVETLFNLLVAFLSWDLVVLLVE